MSASQAGSFVEMTEGFFAGSCSDTYSKLELANWGLLDRAERERRKDQLLAGVAMPPAVLLEVLRAQWADANGLGPEQWLESSGLEAAGADALVSRQWRWQKWCEQRFGGAVNSYYLSRKSGLDRVLFWQLELPDADLAAELYQRLRQREVSFELLAQEFAQEASVTVCRCGPLAMDELSSELFSALQKLEVGALLAPRFVGAVWQILQLVGKEPQSLSAELRASLLVELGEAVIGS